MDRACPEYVQKGLLLIWFCHGAGRQSKPPFAEFDMVRFTMRFSASLLLVACFIGEATKRALHRLKKALILRDTTANELTCHFASIDINLR